MEIGNIVLEHANRTLIDHSGAGNMTALMQAARKFPNKGEIVGDSPETMVKKTEIAKTLLQEGARLICRNSTGKTALDLAENRDEFTDLIIENYDKKLFVRRDGDDLNYLKSLAEKYEAKGDHFRFLKLELLVENILAKFPHACLDFTATGEVAAERMYLAEKILVNNEIENLKTSDFRSAPKMDVLEEAEMLLSDKSSAAQLEMESLRLQLISLKSARCAALEEEEKRLDDLSKKPPKETKVRWGESAKINLISDRHDSSPQSIREEAAKNASYEKRVDEIEDEHNKSMAKKEELRAARRGLDLKRW